MSSDAELIGQRLREAREAKELTLEQAERATRIRARFLEALETGDYSSMSPVQAQGFMRNYARFLQLDIELLMTELEGDSPRGRRRRAALPKPSGAQTMPVDPVVHPPPGRITPRPGRPRGARRRQGILGNLLIIVLAGAIVVTVVVGATTLLDQWAESETSGTDPLPTPTSPLAGDDMMDDGGGLLAGNESPVPDQQTPTVTMGDVPATAIYTPPTLTGNSIALVIEIIQPTWVQVIADGVEVYKQQAEVGEILNYTAQNSINVRANNAAGLQLTVNNQPQGTLGARGEMFDQTYTLDGLAPPIGALTPDGDNAAVPTSPAEATFAFAVTPTVPLDPGNDDAFDPLAPFSMTPPVTDTPSPTLTLAATATPTPTGTPTVTATYTTTPTPSGTYTAQPTATPSHTPTATPTYTPTPTLTYTLTPTPTFTRTFTPSSTWSPTPSHTPTYTLTPTATPFLPPRETRTPTPSPK